MNKLILEKFDDHTQRTNKWIVKARELYNLQVEAQNISRKEKEILIELKELSKHESSIGGGFVFTCTERIGSISYRSIPALQEVDLEIYRNSSVFSWQLKKA